MLNEIFRESYTGEEIIELFPNGYFLDQRDAADRKRIADINLIQKRVQFPTACCGEFYSEKTGYDIIIPANTVKSRKVSVFLHVLLKSGSGRRAGIYNHGQAR